MTIEYNAFNDCTSLSCIYFQLMDSPVFTNISPSNNLPKDFKIVVPDLLLLQLIDIELPKNKYHVISLSEYELLNIRKNVENFDIYVALMFLEKLKYILFCKMIFDDLFVGYEIKQDIFLKIKKLLKV